VTVVKQQAFHSTQAQGISVQPLGRSAYTQLGLLDIYDAQIGFEAPFMTETRVVTDPSNTQSSLVQVKDALGRKRKLSGAFTDPDFARFLVETFGAFDSVDVDSSLVGLIGRPVSNESLLNDLPGSMSHEKCSGPEDTAVASEKHSQPASPAQQASQTTASLSTTPSQQQQLFHRAVTTAMPVHNRQASAAPGAAVAAADDDDDTNSAATMPMPNKRRRTDDDEVTSSPNDLVEVPSSTVVTTASGTAHKAAAATSDTAAGGRSNQQQQKRPAAATAGSTAASAADGGVVKAILVAKVLTKSDSNSKRVILPRIAVEANLPQLAHAQCFNLSATDPNGQSWPLVIKAWANGQNPKPVYVLEQVGELLKQYKITVGDALALLASEDGKFFLEWNSEAVRAAAARPTYSAFTFKQQQPAAVGAAAPTTPKAQQPQKVLPGSDKEPQEAAEQTDQQQQQQQQQPQVVPQQEASAASEQQQQMASVVKQELQQGQQQQTAFQKPLPPRPLMTAVPVTSTPLVSGTFIPTSPCQLLIMGDAGTAPYLKLDDPLSPSLPASMLVLKTRSDAAEKLPEPESLLLPLPAELGDNGALHAGGFLLCPRTPGCTRPAGHQGWCLGHKGYKKRGRV
jgi:hypothetical protein